MGALSKIEIANKITEQFGSTINKGDAKKIVEDFFKEISDALSDRNEGVKLAGLGKFFNINKSARPGRNPKTMEDVEISARRVVSFKSGQILKEKVAHASQSDEDQ